MKTTERRQGGISLSRLTLALFTCGLSVPFVGVRRVKKTTTRSHA
jgi:hypothetical protein